MTNNQSQECSVLNEQKATGVSAFTKYKYLIRHVLFWHALIPFSIAVTLWLITYGHSNVLREFLVFSVSHMLMALLSLSGINFSAKLKDEFINNEPKVNQPDWFKQDEFNREEI